MRQTGCLELYHETTSGDIRDALDRYPQCINERIGYSENQRCSPAWNIKQEDDLSLRIGYFPWKGPPIIETIYVHRADACALFIKHELELCLEIDRKVVNRAKNGL
jgi:hypothetical protein